MMEKTWHKIYEERAKNTEKEDYDACYWTKQGHRELLQITTKLLEKENKNQTILDVGCGTGEYIKKLTQKGFKVIGTDYSREMLKRAQKNNPDTKLIQANIYDLPFPNKSFDITICIGVITCISDYQKALQELKRVTKKKIILSTLLRIRKHHNIKEYIKKKLEKDSWPTIDYHPQEIIQEFPNQEWKTEIKTHNERHEPITDGFFIIAERKK
ncbi:class I SAM-dependent methyltransferase [Candidatus Woesearchaeota archaeon]|nr:class I SAM-dependent methyltransferase [Candidatus Woesearchaeota archaeon]